MIMKYETKMTLFDSYFDANDNLSPKSILSIFQDVAARHADDIGVGVKTMIEKNLYWVLSRVKFDILKMPKPTQTVIVQTWPHEKGRIDFDRDMKILSEDGEFLIIATSKWCVIDTVARKLQRTDNVDYIGEICPDKNYEDRFDKISVAAEDKQLSFIHKVKFSDLDHNGHMNNTNYATLVLNAVSNKIIKHFEINFINECLLDDEIVISCSQTAGGEFVSGMIGDKVVFNAFSK